MEPIRTIAVLTSGGDAPGMNACIRAVVRMAVCHQCRILGVRRGFSGLMAGEMDELNVRSVANILQRGGTILGTSRCQGFKSPDGRRIAADVIRVEDLADGASGVMIGVAGEKIVQVPLRDAFEKKKMLDPARLELVGKLAG